MFLYIFYTRSVTKPAVLGIAEARAELPALVRRMRDDPGAEPVPIGSHSKPTAYLVPASHYGLAGGEGGGLLSTLQRIARPIRSLAGARGISRVRIIGSVARGEDHAGSDIDLLVQTGPETSTIDLAAFALDLEALTGRDVDILDERTLRAGRHDEVVRDAVDL